jgi:hypothetical protein
MNKNELSTLLKYTDISEMLDLILSQMREILGERLIGLYLYGSLVGGDFDYNISDIDLLAATATLINQEEFGQLDRMHSELVKNNPPWENRLEIAYMSRRALKTFKTKTSRAAAISPGEPFHFTKTGKHWLIDWHFVRERGVTLFGPPPEKIIASVSKEELIRAVREQALR